VGVWTGSQELEGGEEAGGVSEAVCCGITGGHEWDEDEEWCGWWS
jgi:hypothetical protein